MARRYSDPKAVVSVVAMEQGRRGGTPEDLTAQAWADAEVQVARLARESGIPCLYNDPLDAARLFIFCLRDEFLPLYQAVMGVYGLTKDQIHEMAAAGVPFAVKVRQLELAQDFEVARKVGRTKKRAFEAAAADSFPDRKLILQAYEPETFVPKTKTSLTIEDLRDAIKTGTDDELAAIAEVELEGAGPRGTDPTGQA
jgi:hypothetical protein